MPVAATDFDIEFAEVDVSALSMRDGLPPKLSVTNSFAVSDNSLACPKLPSAKAIFAWASIVLAVANTDAFASSTSSVVLYTSKAIASAPSVPASSYPSIIEAVFAERSSIWKPFLIFSASDIS